MASPAGAAAPVPARDVDRLFEFSLLGMLASGYFAVLGSGFLDLTTAVVMASALVARALCISGLIRLDVPSRAVTAITLSYIGFYPLDYLFLSRQFVPATVHLVLFLAATKLLTARTDRDYNFVRVVGFLELLAASIVSGSLSFFVCLTLFLAFAVATFATGEIRRSARRPTRVVRGGLRRLPWRIAGLTTCAAIGILALTAGMFFVLPRTARAAFQHLVPEKYHLAGFSNEVILGQIGEIKARSEIVMRVRSIVDPSDSALIAYPKLPPNLKWRGTALSTFDGRRWYNPGPQVEEQVPIEHWKPSRLVADDQRPEGTVPRLHYEVHLQNLTSDVLFFAGTPEFLSIGAPFVERSVPHGGYHLPSGLTPPISYQAWAFPPLPRSTVAPRLLQPDERDQYLQLPRVNPRVSSLAQEWAAGLNSPEQRAEAIERHLRRDFRYSLQLGSVSPADPIADFLFVRRSGHCEYFASSMAVMLRAIGIPSRVVTGFQSGVYNPVSDWQVIRASDAHSWVEAWLPHLGWTVFDPTPPDPNAGVTSIWTRIGFYFDAAETFWQEWVLNYNIDRQLLLALKMQESTRSSGTGWVDAAVAWTDNARVAATAFLMRWGAILAMGLITAALIIYFGPRVRLRWRTRQRVLRAQRGQAQASDATLLYTRMLNLLSRRGFEKPAWTTPVEFARGLPPSDLAPLVEDLTTAYNELRFGARAGAAARMIVLLEQLEQM